MINTASLLFTLAQHSHQIYFAYSLFNKKFIYVNPAFESFFKVNAANASLQQLFALVHLSDKAYLRQAYHTSVPGVFKSDVEFRMIFPDSKHYYLRLNLLIQQEENGEKILTGHLEDISGTKALINKLNDFADKKSAILNIVSHDLAGPLGSIQNIAAILSRKKTLLEDQEVKKWVLLVEEISKKSIHTIQDFVKQEFVENYAFNAVKKRTNLTEAFKKTFHEYQQSEKELGKNLRFQTTAKSIFADIDETQFFLVIENLISNAIKFTPDGGTITVSLEEKEKTILITVADTGIGIPKKFHEHLFDKFNNYHRVGLKGEPSVGLGMSIAKTIVEWHDGKIWFESEENQGTTFYIELNKSN